MQDRIGAEVFAEITIAGGEGVGWGEAALEQQPHRVALVAEGRLQRDQHIAKLGAQHEQRAPVGLMPPGAGPHCASISFR